MKIRAGFVSNSSSTSFLIITKGDLDEKSFFSLMGVDRGSPLIGVFKELYDAILSNANKPLDLSEIVPRGNVQDWFTGFRDDLSPRMIEKLEDARRRGLKVYYGELSSDSSYAECFFCTDSFEAENDKMYFNALECVW